MILQALNAYYERLQADPESGICPPGYSPQKISQCVVLNKKGECLGIISEMRLEGKKSIAKPVIVLGGTKPPGQGINPCTLWDNPAYALGFKPEDTKPERTRECFEAFKQHHLNLEKEVNQKAFSAVCRFLESWNPETMPALYDTLKENAAGFVVFKISSDEGYVHETPEIKQWWDKKNNSRITSEDGVKGICLITGQFSSIARLHEPKIRGVKDSQSAGAALVSFEGKSYRSYGKEQSYNAPVSEQAAFQYCTALNYLLNRSNKRCLQIGDASVVFWTEKPTPTENYFSYLLDPGSTDPEDQELKQKLEISLKNISQGLFPAQEFGDVQTKFYILGLSPNAARLSVRFWYVSTIGEMLKHLQQHMQDLELCGKPENDFAMPAIWQLLAETARESKDIPPLLGGAVMKAIISGQLYPQMLYGSIMRRIRMDRNLNYRRCAILKACLNRQLRLNQPGHIEKEISVSLDPDYPDSAYHMGRLFAALEKAQEDAMGSVNASIKDRFFGSVSATPASVFPRLIRMNQHHMGKLSPGSKIHSEKRIQSICDKIQKFPSHLSLNQQGLFALGYYHQRQDFFTKKVSQEVSEESVESTT